MKKIEGKARTPRPIGTGFRTTTSLRTIGRGRETGLQGGLVGITLAKDTLADYLFCPKPIGPLHRLT